MSNLVAVIRDALPLIQEVQGYLTTHLVAVTGDAGYGKTQLAAQLTAQAPTRPAGILLFGRQLTHRGALDDLVRQFAVTGLQIDSFEELLAALDAAAERARCRL